MIRFFSSKFIATFSETNKQIIYINSKKLIQNIKNSIYDIDYREGTIYIPDYRNNKIIVIISLDKNNY